jgi:hypothetical protein
MSTTPDYIRVTDEQFDAALADLCDGAPYGVPNASGLVATPEILSAFDGTDEIRFGMTDGLEGNGTLFVGDSGVSKSASVFAIASAVARRVARDLGIEEAAIPCVAFPCTTSTSDDLLAPVATYDLDGFVSKIDEVPLDTFVQDGPFVTLFEEPNRAQQSLLNALREPLSPGIPRHVGGVPMQFSIGVFGTANDAPEDGISGHFDDAMAGRWNTVPVTVHSFPWKYWVAGQFPDRDLRDAIAWYESRTNDERAAFNLRCFVAAIRFSTWHTPIPLEWIVPMNGDERNWPGGSEETGIDFLKELAAHLGCPFVRLIENEYDVFVDAIISTRGSGLMVGKPGVGKTASIKAAVHKAAQDTLRFPDGLDVLSMNMTTLTHDGLTAHVGQRDGSFSIMPLDRFVGPRPYVLIMDEMGTVSKAGEGAAMALTHRGERRIGTVEVGDVCQASIAITNPIRVDGRRTGSRKLHRAMASRFDLTIVLSSTSVAWREWNIERFGATAEAVIAWWEHDLTDAARDLVPARVLTQLCLRHEHNLRRGSSLPLERALPKVQGQPMELNLGQLNDRLRDMAPPPFMAMVVNLDSWVERLSLRGEGVEDKDAAMMLVTALTKVKLETLQENRDAVVQLVRALDGMHWTPFVRGGTTERVMFFADVIRDAAGVTV